MFAPPGATPCAVGKFATFPDAMPPYKAASWSLNRAVLPVQAETSPPGQSAEKVPRLFGAFKSIRPPGAEESDRTGRLGLVVAAVCPRPRPFFERVPW